MTKIGTMFRVLAVVALLPLGACDLLEVDPPGRIADDDLRIGQIRARICGIRD